MQAARTRVFALFAEVEAALRADGTLGGAVLFASITQTGYYQSQDDFGANATIEFTVTVSLSRI